MPKTDKKIGKRPLGTETATPVAMAVTLLMAFVAVAVSWFPGTFFSVVDAVDAFILRHAQYIAVTIVAYGLVLVTFLLERLWRWWWRSRQRRAMGRTAAAQPPPNR